MIKDFINAFSYNVKEIEQLDWFEPSLGGKEILGITEDLPQSLKPITIN